MFVLRKITQSQVECNILLGKNYKVFDIDKANIQFLEAFKEYFTREYSELDEYDTYCFVVDENGKSTPLFKGELNFIMTDKGSTFSNLTFKE